MRRALLLVVLLAPAGLALGAPLRVEATVTPGGLDVVVDASGVEESIAANLVVVRRDPILGAVLDRSVPLNLAPGVSTSVALEGLRIGANMTLKLLPPGELLPALDDITGVIDADRLLALPDLANVTTPPIPPLVGGQTHTFRGYTVGGERYGCACTLTATPSGLLFVMWTRPTNPHPATLPSEVMVATSRDGGRTWDEPRVLNSAPGTNANSFANALVEGDLLVAFRETPAGAVSSDATDTTRIVRLDGATGDILSNATWNATKAHLPQGPVPVRRDGALVLAVSEASRRVEETPAIGLYALHMNGTEERVGEILLPKGGFAETIRVHANAAGLLALVHTAAFTNEIQAHVSADGGATWTSAQTPPSVRDPGVGRTVGDSALDETGALHLGLIVTDRIVWTNDSEGAHAQTWQSLLYARRSSVGDWTTTTLAGPDGLVDHDGFVTEPQLVVRGARVWAVWTGGTYITHNTAFGTPTWGAESVTNGLTFDSPYRLRSIEQDRIPGLYDLDLLPDGRPVLLAWYHHGEPQGTRMSAVPLFDPLAPTDSIDVTTTSVSREAIGEKVETPAEELPPPDAPPTAATGPGEPIRALGPTLTTPARADPRATVAPSALAVVALVVLTAALARVRR